MTPISVIVPVYNAEDAVPDIARILRAQTERRFEALFVDDGSTDGSWDACRAAADTDQRFRAVRIPHGGVSAARNAGLARACGRWVVFSDVDDRPETTWLASLSSLAAAGALGVCGYRVVDETGSFMHGTEHLGHDVRRMTAESFLVSLFSNDLMYQGYVWNKVFDRELIEQGEPLRYRDGIAFNEDRLFVFWYLLRCTGVVFRGSPADYVYRAKTETPSFSRAMLSELDAFDEMCRALERTDCPAALRYAQKDRFRAAAQLIGPARSAADRHPANRALAADLGRLCREAVHYGSYASCFGDYPPAFQAELGEALAYARSYGGGNVGQSG